MPSLIETSIDQNNPLSSSQGYEADVVEMDDRDSVESRVSDIISKDSPLMQLSRTQSRQSQAQSGRLNTSMADTAGQVAVIGSATPIASQDAETSSAMKLSNQQSKNTANQFNAGQTNQARSQVYAGKQSLAEIAASGSEQRKNIGTQTEAESRLIAEQGEIEKSLQTADAASRAALLERQAQLDTAIQELRGSQEAGYISQQAQANKEQATLEGEIAGKQIEQRAVIESALVQERGQIEKELQSADAESRAALLNRQGEIDEALIGVRAEYQAESDAVMREFEAAQNEIERAFEENQNAETRALEKENSLRTAATELMRQVSGQNATLTDAIARINASEMTSGNKSSMISQLSQMHYNNLNTTTAMADFNIVDGEVVYNETPASTTSVAETSTADFADYLEAKQAAGEELTETEEKAATALYGRKALRGSRFQ